MLKLSRPLPPPLYDPPRRALLRASRGIYLVHTPSYFALIGMRDTPRIAIDIFLMVADFFYDKPQFRFLLPSRCGLFSTDVRVLLSAMCM